MVKELDRAGIPVVHCCNLINIAEGIGSNRILRGKSVLHAMGDPTLTTEAEYGFRLHMAETALEMLETSPAE